MKKVKYVVCNCMKQHSKVDKNTLHSGSDIIVVTRIDISALKSVFPEMLLTLL